VLTARTTEAAATRDLAAALAALIRPGDLLVLAGDLGAGKTAFTQGLGAALGVTDRITSPTFTIAQEYEARGFTLHHLDVYRLERLDEISDVGLAEILDDGSVVVVEWGDVILPVLPPNFLELRFLFGEGDDDRVLHIRSVGPAWSARWPLLVKALAPWVKES
jgi:tRNA threonylcarbamoyladenosine biosynthesis protein TsaE